MTLARLARALNRGAVLARDANAVKRGRVPQRIGNRLVARAIGRAMRGRWL